jgi:hypothetical protein
MSTKVWAVTRGEYSDYGIVALFESKADAEKAAAMRPAGWDGYRVESFPLYPSGHAPQWVTTYTIRAVLRSDGTVGDQGDESRTLDEMREPEVSVEPEFDTLHGPPSARPKVTTHDAWWRGTLLGKGITVRGSDRKAVVKAFNDRVMQHTAVAS